MPAKRLRMGLAGKLALSLVLSSAAIFAVFSALNLRLHRKGAEDLVVQSADRIGDLIQRSTRYQMLHNDRDALYQTIRDIGSEPGIERVRIFNSAGRISFSTSAEAPLTQLDHPAPWRIYTNDRGHRVLAMIRAIENEPSCSNAACHAHPASQKVLGVIDAHLSLAAVDAQMAGHQRMLAGVSLAAILLVCAVSVGFIWRVVHRPIRALMAGTDRVAGGDLSHRLSVDSRDEFGDLAASFNRMTSGLAAANEEITAWTRTLEDRVDRKTRELERAQTSLVSAEKMASLGKLAATVAHEVNNPLFGILTYARLGLKRVEGAPAAAPPGMPSKLGEWLHVIERESLRCGEIMRNLLTFARQAPSNRDANDLNALVGRAVALVRHRMELQGVELETHLGELPPVPCDAGQIQQIVLALLVNAAEAMAHGGWLSVSTELDATRDQICIRVRDSGLGIPAHALPHIFEPFFTTKEDEHRTGLGLAIGRSIVEQHGGAITANSIEGQGAEFVVTLPIEAVAVTAHTGEGRNEQRLQG